MRRPRMTTRRWMIVVALAGLLIEVGRELKLSLHYRRVASEHRGLERMGMGGYSKDTSPIAGMVFYARPDPVYERYHAALAAKYEYAAKHPWLAVEPDAPMPKSTRDRKRRASRRSSIVQIDRSSVE